MRKKFKHEAKALRNSFKYAFKGIHSTFLSERNMKIHVLIMCVVILCGIFFKISVGEWLICMLLFGIVISAECFNTAIEVVIDMVMPNQNVMAGKAKDIAAGGVLVCAIVAVLVGLIIFVPKVVVFLK